MNWYQGKATSPEGIRAKIIEDADHAVSRPKIGKFYFFWYDPKGKKTLPIYDRFPLSVPMEYYSDGFLGLNVHYLGSSDRQGLLSGLLGFTNNAKLDESTRLRMTYSMLSSLRRFDFAKVCVKRYLYSHCRSRFAEIPANEWAEVLKLPVELFIQKQRTKI